MSLKIRRLNMDTSWEVQWDHARFVLDPWLLGSEIDYFKWFNQQWHVDEPVAVEHIKKPDFILISQSYSDHTHEETLKIFDNTIPILASPKAYKRLLKTFDKNRLVKLPLLQSGQLFETHGLKIASIDPGNKLDPVYYAHVIIKNNKAIYYSSHGFTFSENQSDILSQYSFELLITSFSEISLPKLLGGKVNPGIENVKYLIKNLSPKTVLNTHDEQKHHQGVVMQLATTIYPNLDDIEFDTAQFINLKNYDWLST